MRRFTRLTAALAVSMGVVCAYAGSPQVKALTKVTLGLNWKAEPEFGGFYAAALGGYYQKNGVDVAVVEGGAGTPVVQMVASGRMEYGISAADEVAMSQDRGSDVVAIFAVYKTNPQGVMAHSERGFKSMADVFSSEGSLAIAQGAPYTLFLKAKFKKTTRVKFVPYIGGVGAFLNGSKFSQQCFVTSEPLLARKKGSSTQTFLIADEGFNPYATVLITRRETLNKKPKEVQAVLKAVRQGWEDCLKSPDATNQKMAKLNPSMDGAMFDAIGKEQRPFILAKGEGMEDLGKMSLERWETISKQLLDLKLLRKKPDASRLFVNP